jgi:hypothetical protein
MKKVVFSCILVVILVICSTGIVSASAVTFEKKPELAKIVFITYDKHAKPEKPGKPGGDSTSDYKLSNLKLPGTVSYRINPDNSYGLSHNDVMNVITNSFETWDNIVQTELFNYAGETEKTGTLADNEYSISWAPLSNNIIAQTTMWYVPGKPPRSIVEFDIVFNSALPWGIDADKEGPKTISQYDLQNIATHEAGHPVGLADIYDSQYSYLTMYGYGDIGETQKISLAAGDINGTHAIYGQ